MVLFAIPIVAMKRFGAKAPWWLKAAAGLGFLMSVVGAFFTVFPIIDVASPLLFAAKIIAVVIAANAIGVAIYALDQKRSQNNLRSRAGMVWALEVTLLGEEVPLRSPRRLRCC